MKGKTPIIIAVVIAILLLAVFIFNKKAQAPGGSLETGAENSRTSDTFTSIKDALSQSVSLECKFTDEDKRTTVTYIKNGAVRTNFTAANPKDSGSMIMKNKKMYFWTANNEGWSMEIPDSAVTPGQMPAGANDKTASWSDTIESLEKYKESCKAAVVADSLFTPPATVKFTDYSQMMNQMKQTIPAAGSGTQPSYNEEDIQKMMQQYQTSPEPEQ